MHFGSDFVIDKPQQGAEISACGPAQVALLSVDT